MKVDYRLVEFIQNFREQYGNIDRRKIEVFLDEYAQELNIASISDRTIGKIEESSYISTNQKEYGEKTSLFEVELKSFLKLLNLDTLKLIV